MAAHAVNSELIPSLQSLVSAQGLPKVIFRLE